MKIRTNFLTERGYKAFLIVLGCGGLAALFIDPFLLALALGVAGFIFYDYKKAKESAEKIDDLVRLNSDGIKAVLVAGQSKNIVLSCQVDTGLSLNLFSPLKEVRLKPERLGKGRHNLEVLLSPEISGNYSMDKIGVDVLGPYGLTKKEGSISFDLNVKVFPRVMVALIQAALFLLHRGGRGEGEVPLPLKGAGTDYADTRAYVPGDALHHIDWKATARQARLMVKDFFLEAGQGAHIVYDIRAAGPLSQDKLATTFLNTCVGVVKQEYPVRVTIHNGNRVILHHAGQNPRETLKIVMGYVLESMKVNLEDVDLLVSPATSHQIRRFLNEVKDESIRRALEIEAKVMEDRLKEPYKFLVQFGREMDEIGQFLLISQLSGELVELLQLADEIQRRHQLTIIQPTQPWREAENTQEAQRWHERIERTEKILARYGVEIVSRLR